MSEVMGSNSLMCRVKWFFFWFHNWSAWSNNVLVGITWREQMRHCKRCNKADIRSFH